MTNEEARNLIIRNRDVFRFDEEMKQALTLAIKALKKRPQGEWKLDDTEQFCYCSNCEDTYYPRPLDPSWDFCPHCGADMKGGAE